MASTDTSAAITPAGRRAGKTKSVKQQKAGAAQAVLAALQALHKDQEVPTFRAAARAIVDLRRLYQHEGVTDWTGRSLEYRDAIEHLYRQAEVPPDSESNVQAKIRYHVGNVLREVAPAEELKELGLAVAGPKGRAQQKRAEGGGSRRQPAEVTRTRIDSPLTVAALGLDAVKMLRVMDVQGEDRDIVDGLVRKMLDECLAYLKDA